MKKALYSALARLHETAVRYSNPNMRKSHYDMNRIRSAFIYKTETDRSKPYTLYLGNAADLTGFDHGQFRNMKMALNYCAENYPELDVFYGDKLLHKGTGL